DCSILAEIEIHSRSGKSSRRIPVTKKVSNLQEDITDILQMSDEIPDYADAATQTSMEYGIKDLSAQSCKEIPPTDRYSLEKSLNAQRSKLPVDMNSSRNTSTESSLDIEFPVLVNQKKAGNSPQGNMNDVELSYCEEYSNPPSRS